MKNSSSICSNSRERKVKLRGLISLRKALPIWADAERDLLAGHFEHVLELGEDGLGGLGPQVGNVVGALDRADVGLEHQVERARLGQQAAVFGIVAGAVFHRLGAFAQQRRVLESPLLVKLAGDLARIIGVFGRRG